MAIASAVASTLAEVPAHQQGARRAAFAASENVIEHGVERFQHRADFVAVGLGGSDVTLDGEIVGGGVRRGRGEPSG